MDNLIQRILDRLHGRVFLDTSPDRRQKKLAVVNSFTGRMKTDKNKSNSSPLNNVKALTFKQESEYSKDANLTKTGNSSERNEAEAEVEKRGRAVERQGSTRSAKLSGKNWDVRRNGSGKAHSEKPEVKRCNSVPTEVHNSPKEGELEGKDANGDSIEVPQLSNNSSNLLTIPSVSTSNLLEEIEANLPSSCSLVNVLDHTFHTVTNVRTFARLSRVGKNLIREDEDSESPDKSEEDTLNKVKRLQREAYIQRTLIDQTSKIVKLCREARKNVDIDTETLRILLIASLKYEVINLEIERVKLLGGEFQESCSGQIFVTDIDFKLNNTDLVQNGPFVCVAFHREYFLASPVQNELTNGKLHFLVNFKFQELQQNFMINFELYQLHSSNKKKELPKLLELKNLVKMRKNKSYKIEDPKSEERDFSSMGSASLRLDDIRRRNKEKIVLDFHTVFPFEESVSVGLQTSVAFNAELNGFLDLFKNNCWHRLWCCLTDCSLKFWRYPEDKENGKVAFESISLNRCREDVQPVSMEVCIRPYTFVITHKGSDKGILLSASSYKVMMNWIEKLKSVICYLKAWSPDF